MIQLISHNAREVADVIFLMSGYRKSIGEVAEIELQMSNTA